MVVMEMSGHTAEETIAKLSSIFAELGLHKQSIVTGELTIPVLSSKNFVIQIGNS